MLSHLSTGALAYLILVVAAFSAFMVVLFYGWLRTSPPWRTAERAAPRAAAVTPAHTPAGPTPLMAA